MARRVRRTLIHGQRCSICALRRRPCADGCISDGTNYIERGATVMSSEPQRGYSRKRRLAVRTTGGKRMHQQTTGGDGIRQQPVERTLKRIHNQASEKGGKRHGADPSKRERLATRRGARKARGTA